MSRSRSAASGGILSSPRGFDVVAAYKRASEEEHVGVSLFYQLATQLIADAAPYRCNPSFGRADGIILG